MLKERKKVKKQYPEKQREWKLRNPERAKAIWSRANKKRQGDPGTPDRERYLEEKRQDTARRRGKAGSPEREEHNRKSRIQQRARRRKMTPEEKDIWLTKKRVQHAKQRGAPGSPERLAYNARQLANKKARWAREIEAERAAKAKAARDAEQAKRVGYSGTPQAADARYRSFLSPRLAG